MSKPTGGTVAAVWRRDKGKCWLCGHSVPITEASRDHRSPRALGGYDRTRNYRNAHRACNSARGELPEDRARAVVANYPNAKATVIQEALRAELQRFRIERGPQPAGQGKRIRRGTAYGCSHMDDRRR